MFELLNLLYLLSVIDYFNSFTLGTDENVTSLAAFTTPAGILDGQVTTVSVSASCGGQIQFTVFHISVLPEVF